MIMEQTTLKKYPYYFEVECQDEEETTKSGGISYAVTWEEAAADIKSVYDNIISMYIEFFDSTALIFPIDTARKLKEFINENQ
jgi:hypothetical protein